MTPRTTTTLGRLARASAGCAALAICSLASATAAANPNAPRILCDQYPDAYACDGREALACKTCHTSTAPGNVAWNVYGQSVIAGLGGGSIDTGDLPAALAFAEDLDADGDGLTSLEELELGTAPGDVLDKWAPIFDPVGLPNPRYDVGNYDFGWAFKRVSIIFCGISPTFQEMKSVRNADQNDARDQLHDKLDECLASEFWVLTSLRELADKRIRPVGSLGYSPGQTGIGDFEWDYNLFSWALTDDHDARDMLTAQYHVKRVDGALSVATAAEEQADFLAGIGPQPLEVQYRSGMATTQWFLVLNTMFAGLPRTTAAQVYRAYLGNDIAKQEGILPEDDEHLDIDEAGVDEEECAQCHYTLDGLAYPFTYYTGVTGIGLGVYDPDRPTNMIPDWNPLDPPQGMLLGQPVASVTEWAQVAANSENFQYNLANMLFSHALGREPLPDERDEFTDAWKALPDDVYSANRLLHRLVDMTAWGVP